ncbi:DeoR/GlpR family DNA-binding transcription regulator [Chitinophaga cymbidii]|uniref:DeoR family transcriptional regulator n=1 Tax=Chitinophaga cymbidii TaxID=1096750 RepID=A0A512RQK6_9BACT|nr:DeoR/GlpR family DNA-binding transcription regulator [Chitinophaga cymbidii]GEP97967.1 DeoR family transcriptional regulator [Chitinophaga cymbidii]
MLKEERLDYILKKLRTDQKVLQTELSNDLQVSEDTVRRDLESLAQNGLLIKVRGGAIPHSPNPYSFKERIVFHEDDKKVIARKALSLLENGQTIILDGGTSTLSLAKLFPQHLQLRVITNSVPIVVQLMDHPGVEVIFAGGKIVKDSQTVIGMDTIRMFQKVRADIGFLGVCSLHTAVGVTGPDIEETEVKSTIVEASSRVVALATSDKMGTAEHFKICGITDIDTIVTDQPEDELFIPYRQMGLQVL